MPKPVTIATQVEILRPPEEVFAFAATPANWPIWHPTALSVEGDVDAPLQAGARILEQDRFLFLRGQIRWYARAAEAPSSWTIEGVLEGVPLFSGTTTTVSYRVIPIDGGSRLERLMTYAPSSPIGRLLDRLVFRAHNRHQSQRALDQIKSRLEARSR